MSISLGTTVTLRSGTWAGCLFTVTDTTGRLIEVRLFSNPNIRRFVRAADITPAR